MEDLINRRDAIDAIDEIESEVVDGDGFQYEKWRQYFCDLPSAELQPTCTKLATDKISQFIDGLEEIIADIRERNIDESVCGLCEYDGAYVGQSGDWCNECPGFEKDDCFKLSDKTRKKWTDEIIKALPSAEPRWIPCERELPELASYVLVSHVGSVFVDCLTMENGDLFFWETGVFLAEEIRNLAWMPLPEPWKGGE